MVDAKYIYKQLGNKDIERSCCSHVKAMTTYYKTPSQSHRKSGNSLVLTNDSTI